MTDAVLAATLVAPYDLRIERFPMPSELEPGAVLVEMLASGICGTHKRLEHARASPGPRPTTGRLSLDRE
jgi:threonine dehydrogenase-like Zn-dependent dehydrogenase